MIAVQQGVANELLRIPTPGLLDIVQFALVRVASVSVLVFGVS